MASLRLTLTTLTDAVYQLEVSADLEIENFKALCEVETGIPAAEIALMHNGRPLYDDKKPLKDYGIQDNDMLIIQRMGQGGRGGHGFHNPLANMPAATNPLGGLDFSNIQIPGGQNSNNAAANHTNAAPRPAGRRGNDLTPAEQERILNDPAQLRDALLSRPEEIAILRERNPPLAEALLSNDLEKFTQVLTEQRRDREERDVERIRMLNADPFDPTVQEKIAEEIRLRNVETNMETAMEYAPESFGQVTMLYIDCLVNGHPVKAFVDSGAQMTIMSVKCAERCNIGRLVDRRWAGIAKGVGTQKIIGRVHLGQIQIGHDFLQSSFSILEDQPMDMLLGLDMLKRHQCSIDLKNNCLLIGTTGTKTPFLSESDLPSCARLTGSSSESGAAPMDEDEALAKALQNSTDEMAGNKTDSKNDQTNVKTLASTSTSNPSTSTASAAPPAASPAASPAPVNPANVQQLVSMGFDRTQAETQLRLCGGDVNQAIAALIASSLKF